MAENINYDKLTEFIKKNKELILSGAKEDSLRHGLTLYLPQIFIDNPTWISIHAYDVEHNAVFSDIHGNKKHGFADNAIGLTVFEYEKDLSNKRLFDHGLEQVKDYSAALINEGADPSEVIGILSDTIKWYAYSVKITDDYTDKELLGAIDMEVKCIDYVDLASNSKDIQDSFIKFIKNYFARNSGIPLNGKSLKTIAGIESPLYSNTIPFFQKVISEAFSINSDYASIIKSVWSELISFKNDSQTFNLNDYIDEFYLVTLSKLVCVNALEKKSVLSDDQELVEIISGSFFYKLGITNIVEYDYFGWLSEEKYTLKLLPMLRKMQYELSSLNFLRFEAEDIFGGLVAELAQRENRILLGQEYTPTWLASQMVQNVLENYTKEEPLAAIDMYCGSGVFIVELLKKQYKEIEAENNSEQVEKIMDSVVGFDIDPLAVMVAKVNWILVNRNYFAHVRKDIHIPIYNADSLFLSTPVSAPSSDLLDSFFVPLKIEKHILYMPRFMLEWEDFSMYDEIITKLYDFAIDSADKNLNKLSRETNLNKIVKLFCLQNQVQDEEALLTFSHELVEAVFDLQINNKNGIWGFVLKNSYRPALLKNKFNVIISNPPWLALSKLGSNPYKVPLMTLAQNLKIMPTVSSRPHVDLAYVAFTHAIKFYMKDSGVFAFVLPDTFLNGRHTEPLRQPEKVFSSVFSYTEIWSLGKSIFKNKAISLFGDVNTKVGQIIKGREVEATFSSETKYYLEKMGTKTAYSNKKPHSIVLPSVSPKFEQGADIMPRRFYFYDFLDLPNGKKNLNSINVDSDNYYLVKDAKKEKDFNLTANNIDSTILNDCYISNHITPYNIENSAKCLLPIKKESEWVPLEFSDISNLSIGTRYVIDAIKEKAGKSINELFAVLNTRNKLVNQQFNLGDWLVLVGAGGTNLCAAVIKVDEIEGAPIIDQTIYWHKCSSKEEAYYIMGILNSKILNKLIKEYQPVGSFGARHIHTTPHKMIPNYEGKIEQIDIAKKVENLLINYPLEAKVASDPRKGVLHFRRKKVWTIIDSMEEYLVVEQAVEEYLQKMIFL